MKRSHHSPIPGLGLAALLAATTAPLLAHDDDPKLLDRRGATVGSGFSAGLAARTGPFGQGNQGIGSGTPNLTLLAWLPMSQIDGSSSGNDCWGYVSPSGTEYGIMCTQSGTAFYNLSNPAVPLQVGYIDGPNSTWRDVKVYQDHAYIVSEGGGGIQCVSMANIDSGVVALVGSVTVGGAASTHNVAINEDSGFLYRCGGGNNVGLRIYDLNQSLSNPPLVGQYLTKYVHDVQVVSYTSGPLAGQEVAFCCAGFNNGGTNTDLTILDVTDKANILPMSNIAYPNRAYSHQGWLNADRSRFYLGDELDENGTLPTTTHVFNVTDPYNPVLENSYTNGNTAIGHNMYAHNGFMFQANYTSGLRVLDIATDPVNPVEIGYYDTYPNNDNDQFNGLWSCFPYFPSGLVIGSDVDAGFFVWYFGDPPIGLSLAGQAPALLDPAGDSVDVDILELTPGSLVPGSPMLNYDAGSGVVSVPLAFLGGTAYRATFPSLTCGSTVTWTISAQSTGGLAWSLPMGGEPFSSTVAVALNNLVNDEIETPGGWVGGQPGDTATAGLWQHGDPVATAAQPGDDHTPTGVNCWVTGLSGGAVGTNDVDGGVTTLLSPAFDLTGAADPSVSYWRWYSNDQGGAPNADTFNIDISNNNGSTWTSLEIVGPSGPGTAGGWLFASFRVADFVTPTAAVRLRFRASDVGTGSIVEAAIDDLRIDDVDCGGGLFTRYCSPNAQNSTGQPGRIDATGSNVAADNDIVLSASQLPTNQFAFFLNSMTPGSTPNPGGSMGTLCVGGLIGRYNGPGQVLSTGATGTVQLTLTLWSTPTPLGPTFIVAGQTWNWQAWYRDLVIVPTSNFTDALRITFQ